MNPCRRLGAQWDIRTRRREAGRSSRWPGSREAYLAPRWRQPAPGYDDAGNLTLINYPTSPDVTLGYDLHHRLTNLIDAVGTTSFGYAPGGLLQSEDSPWANDTVSLTYNSGRLRRGLTLQQPSGTWTNGFSYSAAEHL